MPEGLFVCLPFSLIGCLLYGVARFTVSCWFLEASWCHTSLGTSVANPGLDEPPPPGSPGPAEWA